MVPERRMGAAAGARRRDRVLLGVRAKFFHGWELLRDHEIQRRARPPRSRVDPRPRGRRHRLVGRRHDGARGGQFWRGLSHVASGAAAGGRVCAPGRLRWRGAQCSAHCEARASCVDCDAGYTFAVSRRGRGDDAGRRQLHRVPLRVSVPGAGLPGRADSDAAAGLRRDRRRLCRVAAPIRRGPGVVRDRVHAAGRALCRASGGQARRPRVPALGGRCERGGDHLRRAFGPGAVGRRHRLRARRDHRRGAGRHLGLRWAGYDRWDAAGALRARGAADRAAPCRVAVGAHRRPDRRAAAGDHRGRSAHPSAHERARGSGGGASGEEQSGCDSLRDDRRRLADRGRHERLAPPRGGWRALGLRRTGVAARRAAPDRDRRDAEGEGRSLLCQLPGRRGGGGARARRRSRVGRTDEPRRGEAERARRELDHAKSGRHCRGGREQGRHFHRAAQGA